MEASLEFYKSKYEEYGKVLEKNKEYERILKTNKSQFDEIKENNSKLTKKNFKYKEKISKFKEKQIDLELEISKKHTEIDILNVQKEELLKNISKCELNLSEKNKILMDMNEKKLCPEIRDIIEQNNLKSDLTDLINLDNFENFEEGKKQKEQIKIEEEDKKDDIDIVKKENTLLLEKCKDLLQENEKYKSQMQNVESSFKDLQKEKNELAMQLKYSSESQNSNNTTVIFS